MRKYRIADLVIEMDYRDGFTRECFRDFECPATEKTDIYWTINEEGNPPFPDNPVWKKIGGFDVVRDNEKVYAKYNIPAYHMISAIIYEDNYRKATIYMPGKIDDTDKEYVDHLAGALMAFQREMLFFALLNYEAISIHSASIIYKDSGIVFSALSGTGKSTHTNMWNEYYGTLILDGDVTVCRIIDGKSYVYGLPWTGTSQLYTNTRVELKAIVFLQRSETNDVRELSLLEFIQRLIARSFTSRWFEDTVQKEVVYTQKVIATGVKGYMLSCNISKDAVDTIKNRLDMLY